MMCHEPDKDDSLTLFLSGESLNIQPMEHVRHSLTNLTRLFTSNAHLKKNTKYHHKTKKQIYSSAHTTVLIVPLAYL